MDILHNWCVSNKLDLNISKCRVVSYSRKVNIVEYDYVVDGCVLSRCTSSEDLGVIFDSRLTFGQHIEALVSSSMRTMGLVFRNCGSFTNVTALRALFYSLVRSRLEYCSLVWYPIYQTHIAALESVQRRFLKFLSFKIDGVYPRRGIDERSLLLRFNFDSLGFRRILNSLIFLHKLLHNTIDSPHLVSLLNFRVPRVNSRLSSTFYCQSTRTNVIKRSPTYVMTTNFNLLSPFCDLNTSSIGQMVGIARTTLLPLD